MSYEDILYEIEDRVATITINRPEVMNACSLDTYREIEDAFREARDDDEVRVVVLTGSGRAFCAGDDVKSIFLANQEQQDEDLLHGRLLTQLEALRTHARDGRDDLMIHYPKPTIAMVNGVAVGYGCDLALNCDIRIAGTKARMGEFFVRRGLIPVSGGLLLLPRIVGLARAYDLVLSGRLVEAEELERIGMVNRLVEQESLVEETYAYAKLLASQAPLAQKMAKAGIQMGMNWETERMADYCTATLRMLFQTKDHIEGVRAFTEKREADFQGR